MDTKKSTRKTKNILELNQLADIESRLIEYAAKISDNTYNISENTKNINYYKEKLELLAALDQKIEEKLLSLESELNEYKNKLQNLSNYTHSELIATNKKWYQFWK